VADPGDGSGRPCSAYRPTANRDKRLLQAASVIGKDVPFTLLQAIAGVPENSLRQGSPTSRRPSFYTRRALPGHRVHLQARPHPRGRLRERAPGAAARTPCPDCGGLEGLYPDRLAEQVERLAHHAFRGEVWEKSVTYLRQAGAKALARSAYREAVTWFEQALAALHPLPDTREKVERAIDLRLDLARLSSR